MLRKIIILAFLGLITFQFSWSQQNNAALYQQKVESYKKMKNTGIGLTIGGIASTMIGIALVSSAEWETTSTEYGTNTTSSDPAAFGGLLLIGGGVSVSIPGIILTSIGGKKSKEYQSKLERLDVGINYQPTNKGLILSYRF